MSKLLPGVSTITCDKDGCLWVVTITGDVTERQATAIVLVLGGSESHGGTHHHCPEHTEPPEPSPAHNHPTRDIKKPGACPGCDHRRGIA